MRAASITATTMQTSRVVRVVAPDIMPVQVVHRPILKDAITEGLKTLTGEERVADAWHRLLKPDDVILIKFNQSAADRLGTTPAVAEELTSSLMQAGWGPDKLVLLEAPNSGTGALKDTRRPDLRWQGTVVDFGRSGRDAFIAALDQATAIINVPFIKTHSLATMTGCLKNLSHGLIRHPAKFHGGGCDPAIAEIVASRPIRSRLRLNIVNGLRVVFDGGSEAESDAIETAGTLLFGTDAVACDAVGFGIINEIRSLRGLSPLLPGAAMPRQLATAQQLGLGISDMERIAVPLINF